MVLAGGLRFFANGHGKADFASRPTRRYVSGIGSYAYSWEDAGNEQKRFASYIFQLPPAAKKPAAAPTPPPPPSVPHSRANVPRHPLRSKAEPLPAGFPRLRAYMVSYPANRDSLEQTLASFHASDWGEAPQVFVQPDDWPTGMASASRLQTGPGSRRRGWLRFRPHSRR